MWFLPSSDYTGLLHLRDELIYAGDLWKKQVSLVYKTA